MPRFFTKQQLYQDDPQPSAPGQTSHSEEKDFDPIQTLLEWQAPARPFRKKDRSYYTTIAILVILLILIALLAQEFLLIGVILSIAFVAYVLGFIPPQELPYRVSTQGLTIGENFYFWQDLDSFWFEEKEGHQVLHMLTRLRFPTMLMVMIGSQEVEHVKSILGKYLPFHEIPPKSLMEKWADSLKKHFPLETPHH